jgi:DNA-binding HxlR family transcriptional regulator
LSEDKVPSTMKALSDAKSLILFRTIAASSPEGLRTSELNDNLQISSKQLYARILSLMKAGLVRRQGGRHLMTSYGKVILLSLDIMNKASSYYHKLVSIDTIEASDIANNMPEEERRKVVEVLISNQQIRNVLLIGRTLESNIHDTKVQSTQQIA